MQILYSMGFFGKRENLNRLEVLDLLVLDNLSTLLLTVQMWCMCSVTAQAPVTELTVISESVFDL